MSEDNDIFSLKRQRDELRRQSDDNYRDSSKDRLTKILIKKFQTTMIGALSRMEENFGYLWGHNKEHRTEDEEQMFAIWSEVRESILDNGNKQIRNARQEIDQYDIRWNRYQTKFRVKVDHNE